MIAARTREGNGGLPIDLLYRGMQVNADGIALEDGETQLTYRELVECVETLAALFIELLPQRQSRIGLCADNSIEQVITVLAIFRSGHVWVSLNQHARRHEMQTVLDLLEPDLIVVDEEYLDRFRDTNAASWICKPSLGGGEGILARVRAAEAPTIPMPPVGPSDTQSIKFTGGTTGSPKAVVISYRSALTMIANMFATFSFERDEVHLCVSPISHATGTFLLPVLANGGKHVILRRPTTEDIADALQRHDATMVFLVPTVIERLLESGQLDLARMPNFRLMIYGGAPITPGSLERLLDALPGRVGAIFGQTEAPMMITAIGPKELSDPLNLTSVGRPCPFSRVAVVDPSGEPLPAGKIGDVVVRGSLIMDEYFANPEETAKTIRDGWLYTGDLGELDDRGYLYLRGRRKDIIITGGFNVVPTDVEGALCKHPSVRGALVFGMTDPKWGERVEAAIVLDKPNSVDPETLIHFAKEEVGSIKAPKVIHIVPELPRTNLGKPDRKRVRELLGQPKI